MRIYLSHARKDGPLAIRLAEQLRRASFDVWLSEDSIVPGQNWAKETGKALDDAELMVVLLTPAAMESDALRQDIEFALGSRKYEGRLFSVFVGPTFEAGKEMPWILLKQPFLQVQSARGFRKAVREI